MLFSSVNWGHWLMLALKQLPMLWATNNPGLWAALLGRFACSFWEYLSHCHLSSSVGWFSALQFLCMHGGSFSISPGGFCAGEMPSRWLSIPETPKISSLSKCFCRISNTNICLQILMTENTFDYYDVEETPSNRIDVTKDLLIGLFTRH